RFHRCRRIFPACINPAAKCRNLLEKRAREFATRPPAGRRRSLSHLTTGSRLGYKRHIRTRTTAQGRISDQATSGQDKSRELLK
ncbi:MAG TPA: hypothetical protein PLM33_11430, partial [Acidobacteriota bacterium]|nr:hypothetical protein [Acidobacteriota bacterium]